jgi:hypothetical protein
MHARAKGYLSVYNGRVWQAATKHRRTQNTTTAINLDLIFCIGSFSDKAGTKLFEPDMFMICLLPLFKQIRRGGKALLKQKTNPQARRARVCRGDSPARNQR